MSTTTTSSRNARSQALGIALALLALLSGSAQALQAYEQTSQLVAEMGATNDQFGWSVATSGDRIVVGARSDDVGPNGNQGSAYVYRRNGTGWELEQQLLASDGEGGDQFGQSVAIDGELILVGASLDTVGGATQQGSAYVFRWDGASWNEEAQLTASDGEAHDLFGYALATSGDLVAVGAFEDTVGANQEQGSAYVFRWDGISWAEEQHLVAADGEKVDWFGRSISTDGQRIVVGASLDDAPAAMDQGSAYVYRWDGLAWTQEQKLTAGDGESNDAFGDSVSTVGDLIVVGAVGDDVGGVFGQGSAYVFRWDGATWVQEAQLVAADGAVSDRFGTSVSASGDEVLVGSRNGGAADQGSAYVFRWDGASWEAEAPLTASGGAAGDDFGFAVSIHDGTLVVGAKEFDVDGNADEGAVFIFEPFLPPPASLAAAARQPGSLGIFPIHRSGNGGMGGAHGPFFTILSVTNTNLQPQTPQSFGGSTNVHYQYANVVPSATDPFLPSGCVLFDRVEFLTPGDTLSVLTSCHDAVTPGGQQGYVVVSAQDPSQFGVEWSFDHLIGSELVVNASGGIFGLEMVALQSPLMDGTATDVDADGELDFDGNEYSALPDELYVDSFLALAGSRLTLLNLTGGPSVRNTVQLLAWNDNEFPLSATRTFACWFDEPLSTVSPLFTESFLANNTPDDPSEVDLNCNGQGTLETAWVKLDSIGLHLPGGASLIDGAGNPVTDGALLGAITAGPGSLVDGGRLLWESKETQDNGGFNGQ